MANFTTENNTYCFRIGPAFLDTWITTFDFVNVGMQCYSTVNPAYKNLRFSSFSKNVIC